MATLLNNSDLTYVSFPISKVDKTDDGDLLVWGKATDGSVDSDEQIVDPTWSAKALDTWLSTGGNVRVMHSAQHLPAGKGVELDTSSGDGHWVRSLVVEPTAKKLVEKGVLTSYSIGISNPRIVRDMHAKGGRIVDGIVHELSLVDRPANSNCKFALVKSDGDSSVDVAELYGDTDALLAKAKKKPEPPVEDDTDDGTDAGQPEVDSESEPEDLGKSYRAARDEWLAREPSGDAAPTSGTEYLIKRAKWQTWHAEGDTHGLDGTTDGYQRWLAKRAMDANVGGVDLPDSWNTDKTTDVSGDALMKGAKTCRKCGKSYDADAKLRRCEGCGKKLPRAQMEDTVEKTARPLPADTEPAGEHREPDGDAVEALEHDAGMPTDPDPTRDKIPASVKGKKGKKPFPGAKPFGATDDDADTEVDADDDMAAKGTGTYTVKRMHDALCAAYDWAAVATEYPALKSVATAVDPTWFAGQVAVAAAKGDMQRVSELANAAQSADVLAKGLLEPAMLDDARAQVHKSFTDLYPDSGVHPMPDAVTPGKFQRPYLSAGHAPLNASAGRPSNIPPASHVPDPDDFDRPLITAGHETESPADKGNNLDTGGSVASGASRLYYRNASREAARAAMQAMHDHIQHTHPDMCPMAASKAVMPADMGDTNRPTPVQPAATRKAPGEKTSDVDLVKGHLLKAKPAIGKKAIARLIKSASKTAAAQAVAAVTGTYQTTIDALQAEIDELSAQPDPAQAPLRGVVRKAATNDPNPAPAAKRSLVEEAQYRAAAEQDEYLTYLATLTKSTNPGIREQAEEQMAVLTKHA